MDFRVEGTGISQHVSGFFNNTPEFDPLTGNHHWAIFANWKCADPQGVMMGKGGMHLDRENLESISPPMCLFCEKVWTPQLALHKCEGVE